VFDHRSAIMMILSALLILPLATAIAEEEVRVATYNIKYLDDGVVDQGDRRDKLIRVIAELDADVVALQEIKSRSALEKIFDEDDWYLIIDDDSNDRQNLALAVRKPLLPVGHSDGLDAETDDFLFPDQADNQAFPKRRDVLCVQIRTPITEVEFWVMVVHAKARAGGRAATDERRGLAARMLVQRLETEFDEEHYILLGDFNDNPDDRSLNILESGNPYAMGGPEMVQGPFLINLAETLCAEDVVNHGLKSNDIDTDSNRVVTVAPDSRDINNEQRGTDTYTGDILFDQILIPFHMLGNYVDDSIAVLDHPDGVLGNNTTRASDHLPVYADFVFVAVEDGSGAPSTARIHIVAALPNPQGQDAGHEQIVLRNVSDEIINLEGWQLIDRGDNSYQLAGELAANEDRTLALTVNTMPLNNSGDTIRIHDDQGSEQDQVTYTHLQVQPGIWIQFR